MEISALNSNASNFYKKEVKNTGNQSNKSIENKKELSVYPRPYFQKFGNSELKAINFQTLPDVKIDEEFSKTELVPNKDEHVNLQDVFDLIAFAQKIRHFEQTGEMPQYQKDMIIEECKYNGLSEEETNLKLREETNNLSSQIKQMKENSINAINSLTPTEQTHEVYRIIGQGYSRETFEYFQKIKNLKSGDSVILDPTPIYVSTSAKNIVNTYGGLKDSILFNINLPTGSKLIKFPPTDGINQAIMKPDSKFKVINNETYKDNFHVITLEYLPD